MSHGRRTLLFLTIKCAKFVPQRVDGYDCKHTANRSEEARSAHDAVFVLFLLKMAEQSGNVTILCPGRGGFLLVIQTVCKCPSASTDARCFPSFGIHKQL